MAGRRTARCDRPACRDGAEGRSALGVEIDSRRVLGRGVDAGVWIVEAVGCGDAATTLAAGACAGAAGSR